jgi:hypothetical protein
MGYPILLLSDSSPEPWRNKFYSSRGLELSGRFVLCSRGFFWWVRASAPTECSPQGLGWVVYPLQGLRYECVIVELWATLAVR